jgi:hypothetical protein
MPDRRFAPPWDIEDNGECFIVRDANGHPDKAREVFDAAIKHRPRIRLTIRQRTRDEAAEAA